MEVELKFLVPRVARTALLAELARHPATHRRISLAAMYLDTDDRRLADAGLAWRVRREGRRWVQTLKSGGPNALERFEHEVVRPDASHDAVHHAGTPVGDHLIAVLHRARRDGVELGVRYRTEVRRTTRQVRTRGAVVEIAFDEGRLLAGDASERIHELEFELVSGSVAGMLALAERWRKRYGLVYDPRSKAERGDRLADGHPHPKLRKAAPVAYAMTANAVDAFGSVLDECLAHITRNVIGLIEGDQALRIEHVHQLRVGIRRLRSALRSFRGWTPPPPADLVDGLRSLFNTLGETRDSDVLGSGVVAELTRVGAPPLTWPATVAAPDPVEALKADAAQANLLAWIAWRSGLVKAARAAEVAVAQKPLAEATSLTAGHVIVDIAPSDGVLPSTRDVPAASGWARAPEDHPPLRRLAQRRLRQWHRRIVADWNMFDELDDAALHALRKRIKRQRYAVEFFSPVLRRRQVRRYQEVLAAVQERMGQLNDLYVARDRYQSFVESDPAAWFALGWLAARISAVRLLAKPELGRLAKEDPPTA
jgi:triphosphatase